MSKATVKAALCITTLAWAFASACGADDLDLDSVDLAQEALTGTELVRSRKIANPNAQFTGAWVDGGENANEDRFDNSAMSPDGRFALAFTHVGVKQEWLLTPTQAPASSEVVSASGSLSVGFLDTLLVRDVNNKPLQRALVRRDGSLPYNPGDGYVQQIAFTADPRLAGGFALRIGGATSGARLDACATAEPGAIVMAPASLFECRRLIIVQRASSAGAGVTLRSALVAIVSKAFDSAHPQARIQVPEIESAVFVTPFREMKASGRPIVAIEPTATADSRLLVYSTGKSNFIFNETPWDATTWSNPSQLFLINKTVAEGGIADLKICLATRSATGVCRGSLVTFRERYPLAAFPFRNADGSLYRGESGNNAVFGGRYPWISFEGTEIFFGVSSRGTRSYLGQGTKGAFKYLDHQVNVVRGKYCISPTFRSLVPGDTDCDEHEGTRMAQPLGTSTGIWRLFPEEEDGLLPLSRRTPMHVLVDTNQLLGNYGPADRMFNTNTTGKDQRRIYVEAPMDDFSDGKFVAVYHLNELLKADNDRVDMFDSTSTPDTSGNYYTARLNAGALFPFEHDGNQDLPGRVNPGFLGRALYLRRDGNVVVTRAAAKTRPGGGGAEGMLGGSFDRLTVELAFKQLVAATQFTKLPLAAAPKSWKLELARSIDPITGNTFVEVVATLHTSDSVTVTLRSGAVQQVDFNHVALSVERPSKGSTMARLFVNGGLRKVQTLGANLPVRAVPLTEANLLVLGPNGVDRSAPGGTDLLLLDEVAVSSVARSAEYIANAAYQRFTLPGFTSGRGAQELPRLLSIAGTLPLGLNASELRVPNVLLDLFVTGTQQQQRTKFARIQALGESLFGDDLLTVHKSGTGALVKNAGRSCASCHVAAEGFAHKNVGLDAKVTSGLLAVNTPTALNRAFSTAQFFDQRSPNIVDQVTKPLENADEMGGKIVDVLTAINSQGAKPRADAVLPTGVTTYKQWFTFAFGATATVGKAQLEQALAVFTLSLLSGSSNVDQVLAGESTGNVGLDEQLKRGAQLFFGKARCVACHSGSNFTDETRHASGPSGQPTKTPTLRDVSLTAPYFKDGSRATLAAVVEHYNDGGCRKSETIGGTTITRLACDPELFPLGLTAAEKQDLVTFLANFSGQ